MPASYWFDTPGKGRPVSQAQKPPEMYWELGDWCHCQRGIPVRRWWGECFCLLSLCLFRNPSECMTAPKDFPDSSWKGEMQDIFAVWLKTMVGKFRIGIISPPHTLLEMGWAELQALLIQSHWASSTFQSFTSDSPPIPAWQVREALRLHWASWLRWGYAGFSIIDFS